MPCDVVLGAQWGDEGKAKIIDSIAKDYDIVVRFQGGSNAGHTVYCEGKKYVFQLIPSGVLYPDKISVLGNGVVINLKKLVEEMDSLRSQGIIFKDRFFISDRASIVLPFHMDLDAAREGDGKEGIGTTKQGIGPAYVDKAGRLSLRVGDLKDKGWVKKILEKSLVEKEVLSKHLYGQKISSDVDQIIKEIYTYYESIKEYVIDTSYYLNEALLEGKNLLLEGAQGMGLDVDFGTYPYVTSSNSSTAGIISGTGINFRFIRDIVAVVKIYNTRVGKGPFPSKMEGDDLKRTQEIGGEFGSVTGRPRDCGWFDVVHTRFSNMICGFSKLAVTKLDVFDDFDLIKVCVAYEIDGKRVEKFPSNYLELIKAKPIYEEFEGWKTSTKGLRHKKDLPKQALSYAQFIEKSVGVRLAYLSNGPDRSDVIVF